MTFSNTQGVCTKPEADERVNVLDLKTFFHDQNFGWTLPTKLDITDSSKSGTSFDLDGDFDANMVNSRLTDADKDLMRSVRGGGFMIDSILLEFTDGEPSSIVINGTRVPKDIMPSRFADGMEWYRPS